jgi:hypothetical protein
MSFMIMKTIILVWNHVQIFQPLPRLLMIAVWQSFLFGLVRLPLMLFLIQFRSTLFERPMEILKPSIIPLHLIIQFLLCKEKTDSLNGMHFFNAQSGKSFRF